MKRTLTTTCIIMVLVITYFWNNTTQQQVEQPTAQPTKQLIVIENTNTPVPTAAFNPVNITVDTAAIVDGTEFYELATAIQVTENQTQGWGGASTSYTQVETVNLPVVSGFGPPCEPGHKFYTTGWLFDLSQAAGHHYHPGWDGACSGSWNIALVADGTIVYTGDFIYIPRELRWTWASGNTVVAKHNLSGTLCWSIYAHLASISVTAGETVSAGTRIGIMGNTGNSLGNHLHINIACEINGQMQWLNPNENGILGTR